MATGETEPAGSRPPVPDPTTLTTEQMLREVANLKELVLGKIAHEADICTVQFKNVDGSFSAIAFRTAEQKEDTKAAVDAALQAAKEAVAAQTAASDRSIAKSEAATAKEIDALKAQLAAAEKASGEKLSDVKTRLDRIEAGKLGGTEATVSSRETQANIRATILAVAAILSTLIAVIGFALANKP